MHTSPDFTRSCHNAVGLRDQTVKGRSESSLCFCYFWLLYCASVTYRLLLTYLLTYYWFTVHNHCERHGCRVQIQILSRDRWRSSVMRKVKGLRNENKSDGSQLTLFRRKSKHVVFYSMYGCPLNLNHYNAVVLRDTHAVWYADDRWKVTIIGSQSRPRCKIAALTLLVDSLWKL